MKLSAPSRRTYWLMAAFSYLLAVFISVWLLRHVLSDAGGALRTLVALLPLAPITWLVTLTVQKMLTEDELQQRINLEAIAIASLALSLGTLTLSLLMVAGVVTISGRTALTWIFPALWIGYGFARHWAARRYR